MIVSVTRSFSESGKTRMRAKSFERRQAENFYALKCGESQSSRFALTFPVSSSCLYPGIPMDVGKVKLGNLGKMA